MTEWILRDSRLPEMVVHPSTQGAVLALRELASKAHFKAVLDLGCGSGLLSLIATELWPESQVLAADISEKAVKDAELNIQQYGLESRIRVVRSDGFSNSAIRQKAPYTLILCNLLAELLTRVAPDVKSHLVPDGIAVLSGILSWMLPQVRESYLTLGFEIAAEIELGEWRTLIVRQPG